MCFIKESENPNHIKNIKLGMPKDYILKYKDEITILKNAEIIKFDRVGNNSCRVFYKLKKMTLK